MIVEYAGIVALALLASTLTGAYGQNVAAVFASSGAGVTAVGKAARAQHVSVTGAKAAYKRAPYAKPVLKYLYAMGWIGGTETRQCGLTLIGQDAARQQAKTEILGNRNLLVQLGSAEQLRLSPRGRSSRASYLRLSALAASGAGRRRPPSTRRRLTTPSTFAVRHRGGAGTRIEHDLGRLVERHVGSCGDRIGRHPLADTRLARMHTRRHRPQHVALREDADQAAEATTTAPTFWLIIFSATSPSVSSGRP